MLWAVDEVALSVYRWHHQWLITLRNQQSQT